MGFGLRIAPGVRVSATRRGLRTGIGPRVARVHVGSGPTGFSTGAGPFTYFTESGSPRRPGQASTSVAAYERQVRALQRQQQIDAVVALDRELDRVGSFHTHDFPVAQPPAPAEAPPVDERALLSNAEKEELKGVPLLRRSLRKAARQQARTIADERIADARKAAETEREMRDFELAKKWQALTNNEPAAVLSALKDAFADNESPASAVRVEGASADLVMYWPQLDDLVGERKPALTPTGKPTHHKRSITERNALYLEVMAANVLATVKEAFAVAPGLTDARLLVVRQPEVHGVERVDALFAGQFGRETVDRLDWSRINPAEVLKTLEGAELRLQGRTQEVVPLDVSDDAQLNEVLEQLATSLGWRENTYEEVAQ